MSDWFLAIDAENILSGNKNVILSLEKNHEVLSKVQRIAQEVFIKIQKNPYATYDFDDFFYPYASHLLSRYWNGGGTDRRFIKIDSAYEIFSKFKVEQAAINLYNTIRVSGSLNYNSSEEGIARQILRRVERGQVLSSRHDLRLLRKDYIKKTLPPIAAEQLKRKHSEDDALRAYLTGRS